MTRVHLTVAALTLLIGLTGITWWLAESDASPALLAIVAFAKITIIAAIFLELPRSWPGWSIASLATIGVVLGAIAGLMSA